MTRQTELMRSAEGIWKIEVDSIIPAPASPPTEPNLALQRTRFAQR